MSRCADASVRVPGGRLASRRLVYGAHTDNQTARSSSSPSFSPSLSTSTSASASSVPCDYGAQYFTVRDAGFAEYIAQCEKEGLVREWKDARIRVLHSGTLSALSDPSLRRFVGKDGACTLVAYVRDSLPFYKHVRMVPLPLSFSFCLSPSFPPSVFLSLFVYLYVLYPIVLLSDRAESFADAAPFPLSQNEPYGSAGKASV